MYVAGPLVCVHVEFELFVNQKRCHGDPATSLRFNSSTPGQSPAPPVGRLKPGSLLIRPSVRPSVSPSVRPSVHKKAGLVNTQKRSRVILRSIILRKVLEYSGGAEY